VTLSVVGETKQKLEHVPERLTEEFPEIDPEQVTREVTEVAGALLQVARFPDYVPLFAYRFTRERLVDQQHGLGRAA
jgi:hypothetical protein